MNYDNEEIRLLRNEYARNWRKQNPDKVKATNERFYKRLKEKKQLNTEREIQNEAN